MPGTNYRGPRLGDAAGVARIAAEHPTRVDAVSLHRLAIVADTHNDLLCSVVVRPVHRWGGYFRERWLPQLTAGGVDVQVLPVFVDDLYRPERALRQTLRMIEAAHRIAEENADAVALCTDGAADQGGLLAAAGSRSCWRWRAARAWTPTSSCSPPCTGSGVRIASLAHFGRNAFADGSAEDATGSRLTSLGVAAVRRAGAARDHPRHLAPGRTGVDHVLEISRRPVMATHSSARALRDHHRNLDDEQLAAVAKTGGVVCVNFYPGLRGRRRPERGPAGRPRRAHRVGGGHRPRRARPGLRRRGGAGHHPARSGAGAASPAGTAGPTCRDWPARPTCRC